MAHRDPGYTGGGGGGDGGQIVRSKLRIEAGQHGVTIGAGGKGGRGERDTNGNVVSIGFREDGLPGEASVFLTVTANGGAGGKIWSGDAIGGKGGKGASPSWVAGGRDGGDGADNSDFTGSDVLLGAGGGGGNGGRPGRGASIPNSGGGGMGGDGGGTGSPGQAGKNGQDGVMYIRYMLKDVGAGSCTAAGGGVVEVKARGGSEVYEKDGYRYHVFKDNGTFVLEKGYGQPFDLLVVGAGGGGGRGVGGGGGGGEFVAKTVSLNDETFTVVVGAGGGGGGGAMGVNGSQSSFSGDIIHVAGRGGGGGGALH